MVSGSTAYSVDGGRVSLTIFNNTDQDAMFGAAYALEIQNGDAWYDVPLSYVKPGTEPTWAAISYELPAHGSAPAFIDLGSHGEIEPGQYRVIKQIRSRTGSGEPVHIAARFAVLETRGNKTEYTIESDMAYINTATIQDKVLASAVPSMCKALWDIKAVDLVGFKRTWASRQAVFDERATTLTFEAAPKVHDRVESAQWTRAVENGIALYRQSVVTHSDFVDGSSSDTYSKALRVESGLLTGILRRETGSRSISISDVSIDDLRQVAVPMEGIPGAVKQTDERWTVRLENGQVSLEISVTPPPFNGAAMTRWASASAGTIAKDGLVEYRFRKEQATSSRYATIDIAYPASIGLVEVKGRTLSLLKPADAAKALAFIDVNFVREMIARLEYR